MRKYNFELTRLYNFNCEIQLICTYVVMLMPNKVTVSYIYKQYCFAFIHIYIYIYMLTMSFTKIILHKITK